MLCITSNAHTIEKNIKISEAEYKIQWNALLHE
jgi:hypothetical protein